MARFLERISESTVQWYDALSERERRLLTIFSIVVVSLVIVLTIYLGVAKLNARRAELVKSKQQLTQILELEDDFKKAKEKAEKARLTVMKNDVSLFAFIQAATSKLGLVVKDLNEQKRPLPKSDIIEISVRLNLSKLSIDKVMALIEAIETSEMGKLIKVTKLKINKRFDEPDLLDLQMTVSTWKTA